ncbi:MULTISPECIES: spore germination protein [Halobacillus]|uniref:Spore germination protein n=2 Tax=Halobacillus TaxID=45667 RepID=A0A3E0J6I1_9BACI|nr:MULTISPECIES: spore germination protein [Halobacillus]RDY71487.1 spore germination protein [Halobacillus trueperi]REJ08419.1 spore germination protein [Halobacillus trueperi]SDP53328.1 spore germination protein PA [Halobacillus aidingensis]
MPAKVGAVKVISLSSSSIFNIGDVYNMAPYASAKTFAGGGSFNTGDGIRIRLNRADTFINDSEVIDQPIANNA